MSQAVAKEVAERFLTKADFAKQLDCSVRHIQNLNTTGRIPKPVTFGRCVRWSVHEIESWIKAGCPNRDRWETMKAEASGRQSRPT